MNQSTAVAREPMVVLIRIYQGTEVTIVTVLYIYIYIYFFFKIMIIKQYFAAWVFVLVLWLVYTCYE